MDTEVPRMRVLVVDDCHDTCTSFAWLVEKWGYDCRTACDGRSAIEQEAAFEPEVILLDIGLPDIDGLEVLRRIRNRKPSSWPFVMCASGWADEATRAEAREAGCDAFLIKPLDLETVRGTLKSISVVSRIFRPAGAAG